MFADLECPYGKSKRFTLTYDDIRPPSVTHTHFCPPQAATARNKATSLSGRSAGCHISPQRLKKIIPAPHDSAPSGYTATPPTANSWVSKRGDFRHREVSQKQTDAPALACDDNPPPLKSKGRTDPLTALDRSDSCKIKRSLRLQLRLKSSCSPISSSPTAHGRRPSTVDRTHAAAGGEQRHNVQHHAYNVTCVYTCVQIR